MTLLQLDASARPGRAGTHSHGSLTRRLTHRFVQGWKSNCLGDEVIYRDLGATPPSHIDGAWIEAAFAGPEQWEPRMAAVLAESDRLIEEVLAADVLLIGAPLYNFGMPAALKTWIDQIVRVGKTVDFDPSKLDDPFTPLLTDRERHAVILSSRGGQGLEPGGELAHMNHLEPHVKTALGFIGIEQFHCVAIECQEFGGELLAASIANAESQVDRLVNSLAKSLNPVALASA
ncbi:FMN-dependent NADH-azoreductase [Gilvimarinus sp. F26214L]|uniref:FMN-dependent NADH-azoreductase n=1 Tax=Gilvimarinus sp. DZF01 TaxID=3461371 RepID=UPI004045AC85